VRHTDDVDCIIEVVGPSGLSQLEVKLRSLGFVHHPTSAVLCRWLFEGITVDIMPTLGTTLGFTNRWYALGWPRREPQTLPKGQTVYILPFAYFFATKLEAFCSRGCDDWAQSKDLEDLVAVLDGRTSALTDLLAADDVVFTYIRAKFALLTQNEQKIVDAIHGHLLPGDAHQQRAPAIFETMKRLGS
jgi:hypothetical protein